ncbi:hypothetical protein NMG60_11013554 [Bertholletia excelsa]
MNGWERSLREERYPHHQQRRKTQSFSSSLLDAIYRSIDESNCDEADESVLHREPTAARMKKQRNSNSKRNSALDDEESLRRAIMIEKWMENENRSHVSQSYRLYNSTSSSSDSSCGGVFSSSETESGYKDGIKPTSLTLPRPKQVRGASSARSEFEQTPKREGRLMKTKSKALKIYGDLKKVKQPISPGRRITNFLNSLFNSRNVKNAKRESLEDLSSVRKSRSVRDTTTCSLSSSFSRSCLSKPPSSRAKLSSNNGSKRSVRFCSVGVIVDEDSRPCGHKYIYEEDPSLMPTPIIRKIADSSRLKSQLKSTDACQLSDFHDDDHDEQEEDDGMSCTSSDLFELENIGGVGVRAYREELPVYGTTTLKTQHAIANGWFL